MPHNELSLATVEAHFRLREISYGVLSKLDATENNAISAIGRC